jgi:hypothetical protein
MAAAGVLALLLIALVLGRPKKTGPAVAIPVAGNSPKTPALPGSSPGAIRFPTVAAEESRAFGTPAPAVAPNREGAQARRERMKTRIRFEFREPRPGSPTAYLVAEDATGGGRRTPIDQPQFWIGAAENNNFVIDEESVSGNHVCILFEHADLYLWDSSLNGTMLNGVKVHKERRPLSPNDTIQIGKSVLRLSSE